MQQRQYSWFSCGPLRRTDADDTARIFTGANGSLSFSRSGDGWTRLSIYLEPEGTTDAPPVNRSGPARERSWALDPATAAGRAWQPLDVSDPDDFAQHRTARFAAGNGGVEGNVNPHEDTRGIVPVEIAGQRFAPSDSAPVEAIEVSRGRDAILVSIPLDAAARVYGLGEKTGTLDKRGRTWTMWNSDEPDHTPERDPLYESIPVAYLFTPAGTTTIFADSTAVIYFDVGEADASRLQIELHDTAADIYLRRDASLPEAVAAYTGLTGRHELPPEWALGFQQCRYSYFPDTRVIEVAEELRRNRVPADVIYLDIHYMDGYRVFTWDRKRFPDPAAMTARLRELGFRVVTIVDPGVKADPEYPVFAEGAAGDLFLTEPTGGPYVGTVWPGKAVFPDFTAAATREWWAAQHHHLFDVGIAGIWNDMNEPADFSGDEIYRPDFTVPDRLIARNDGHPASMARLHNAYGIAMNSATRDAFRRQRPEERGFVLTRSGYAGVQRTAAVWTGDNHSWWEHIGLLQPMILNLGLSGVAFAGGDVGGFQLNASPELYARWIAAASLTPFFRAHSALDTVDHEPWSFGDDVLEITRRWVGLRYRLMPYIYTLFEAATRTGAPVMRPLVWEYPADERVHNRADSFLLGSAILAAPVGTPGVQERAVYLPAGVWYDFWTGERIVAGDPSRPGEGGVIVAVDAPVDRMPLFVRGGSIVPFEALRQHTGERGDGVLRLLVAPDEAGRATGAVYADGGEGFAYRTGAYRRFSGAYEGVAVRLTTLDGDGTPEIRWDRVTATVLGAGVSPAGALGVLEDCSRTVESSPAYPLSDAEVTTIEV